MDFHLTPFRAPNDSATQIKKAPELVRIQEPLSKKTQINRR